MNLNIQLTFETAAAALVVVVAGVLAGCSGGGGAAEHGDDGLTKIKVIVSPVVDGAPIFYAAANGLFEEHGLDVEVIQAVSGGQAMIPILPNRDTQFGATARGR